MGVYVEIKNIVFNHQKKITPEWREELYKVFPEAKKIEDNDIQDFLYFKAYPYDELSFLEKTLGYTKKQMEEVKAARDLIKYFIISIERNPDYIGSGNGF